MAAVHLDAEIAAAMWRRLQLPKNPSMLTLMAGETKDFNREHLNRFDGVDTKLDRILQAIETLTARIDSLEQQVSLERKEARPVSEDLVRLEHRIDRVNARLDHIEMRLDLMKHLELDTPPA